jgi:hypothetical protein
MGRAILGPAVRFDFDDPSRDDCAALAMQQDLSEQRPRDP